MGWVISAYRIHALCPKDLVIQPPAALLGPNATRDFLSLILCARPSLTTYLIAKYYLLVIYSSLWQLDPEVHSATY